MDDEGWDADAEEVVDGGSGAVVGAHSRVGEDLGCEFAVVAVVVVLDAGSLLGGGGAGGVSRLDLPYCMGGGLGVTGQNRPCRRRRGRLRR